MTEYGDPISPEQIECAVEKVLDLHRVTPELSLDDQVSLAVAETICGCVLGIEDDLEGHLSGTHACVLNEVKRQVDVRLAGTVRLARDNEVDEASEQSFPASDPPGWIWERPGHRANKEQ